MKLSFLTMLAFALFVGLVPGTAAAVMVDFELPAYTAGSNVLGVDGWEDFLGADAVVTPSIDETRVLAGSQSMRLTGGRSIVTRPFDGGPIGYDTGTVVSTHMLVDDTVGAMGEFYFSHKLSPSGSSTPAGIIGVVGGNFQLFGKNSGGTVANIDTGIAFSTDRDYLLEIELDLDTQAFNAYATDIAAGATRTSLGSAGLAMAGHLLPSDYATSGFALISRVAPVIFDDLDVDVVLPPDPTLPLAGTVDFENERYVAGSTVIGVDGWRDFLGATAIVTPDAGSGDNRVLEGAKNS